MSVSIAPASRKAPILLALMLMLSACSGSTSDEPNTTAAGDSSDTTVTTTNAVTETTQTETVDPPRDLEGQWVIDTYRMSTGSMTNTLGGDAISLTFADNGTLVGYTGCNDYLASYEVVGPYDPFEEGVPDDNDGQQITITLNEVSDNPCDEGFDAEQDADLLTSLEGTDRWFIARGNLILRGETAYIEATPSS